MAIGFPERRERMRMLYEEGNSTVEIADLLKTRNPSTVAVTLRRMGVRMRPRGCRCGRYPEQRKDDVLRLYEADRTVRDISEELRISTSAVTRIFRDSQVPRRFKRKKLSPTQSAEVARLYSEYTTYEDLGRRFDCSASVIQAALKEHGIKPRRGWTKYRTTRWTDRKGREHLFKSSWELAFAAHLDAEGADWAYEPRSYPLKECRCYTPDFEVREGGKIVRLIEIHGWMDARTQARLVEFCQTYTDLPFELFGPAELAALGAIDMSWAAHPQSAKVSKLSANLSRLRFQQKVILS